MTAYRRILMGLAILNLLFTGLTAAVGLFADGGAIYSRLVLSALHPLTALAILLLVFAPRLTRVFISMVIGLIAFNIVADLTLSGLIASGTIKGDWELPLFFAIVPTIAVVYAINQLRSLQAGNSDSDVDGNVG